LLLEDVAEESDLQHSFKKHERIVDRSDFQQLFQKGQLFTGAVVLISWRKTSAPQVRLGITVTKKFGKAYLRNRFKRLVREAFRLTPKPSMGLDMNVRPKSGVDQHTVALIAQDLTLFFNEYIK
jgi:ribonuclease P protein component